MKTLLGAIVEILASLALFALGTLLAVFFIVIFLIWGWPLTILLLLVVVKKLYFSADDRRKIWSKFDRPRRHAPATTFQSALHQESRATQNKDRNNTIDEQVPRLLN
ncbi:MAG: hypothetical protein ACLPVO_20050 [Desulfomonilaceae bacterium]